jgi:hypothetical protein
LGVGDRQRLDEIERDSAGAFVGHRFNRDDVAWLVSELRKAWDERDEWKGRALIFADSIPGENPE